MVRGTKVSIKQILESNIVIILTIFLAKAPNISAKLVTQDRISLHKIPFFSVVFFKFEWKSSKTNYCMGSHMTIFLKVQEKICLSNRSKSILYWHFEHGSLYIRWIPSLFRNLDANTYIKESRIKCSTVYIDFQSEQSLLSLSRKCVRWISHLAN